MLTEAEEGGDMDKNVYDPTDIEADVYDRSNHTGEQSISTITGLQQQLSDLDPTIETNLELPLVFSRNRIAKILQDEDITLNVASSGHSDKFTSYDIVIDGDSSRSITWAVPYIDMQGDAFNTNKKNAIKLIWDGNSIVRASNQVSNLSTPPTPLELDSFIITNDAPNVGQLTFNVAPTSGDMQGFSFTSDFGDVTILSILSKVGNVWTVQLSRDAISGEAGNVVYTNSTIESNGQFLADGSSVVTNQVGNIVPNPNYISSEIGSQGNDILGVTVDVNSNFGEVGISLSSDNGDALFIMSPSGTTNATTGFYTLNRHVADNEVVTIDIITVNGIVNALDITKSANPATGAVTNNSTFKAFYFDSEYTGNQNGTFQEPYNSLASINTGAIDINDSNVLIKSNSFFRDRLNVGNASNVIIDVYGSGDTPEITGADIYSSFVLESGNVWSTSVSVTGAPSGRIKVFEDGLMLDVVEDIATCNSTAGSYVRQQVAGTDTYNIYFHPSDSLDPNTNNKIYEISNKPVVYCSSGASNISVNNIKTGKQINNNGSVSLLFGAEDNEINDVIAVYGDKHNLLLGQGVATGVVAWGHEVPSVFGDTTMIVSFTDATNTSPIKKSKWDKVSCIQPDYLPRNNAVAFFGHAAGVSWDEFELSEFYVYRVRSIGAGNANTITFDKVMAREVVTGDMRNASNTFNLTNSSILWESPGNNSMMSNSTTNFINNLLCNATHQFSFTPALVYLTNNTCFNPSAPSFFNSSTYPSTINANYNVFTQGVGFISADSYIGDYNIYGNPDGSFPTLFLGGDSYGSLSSWVSATNQDVNSVYLTAAQYANFYLGDPLSGDYRINPLAQVTGVDGTVYTGTFGDGVTPIALAGCANIPLAHPDYPELESELPNYLTTSKTYYNDNAYTANPLIVNASVENNSRSELFIVLSSNCDITDLTGISLNFTNGTPKTITNITSGSGTFNFVFEVSEDIEFGDEFELVYDNTNTISDSNSNAPLIAGSTDVQNKIYTDVTNGLIAKYEFEQNADDSSGNGNNGTDTDVTYVNDSVVGTSSASFNGVSSIITTPVAVTDSYTISFWEKVTDNNINIFAIGTGSNASVAYRHPKTLKQVQVRVGNNTELLIGDGVYDIWVNRIITYDNNTGEAVLYTNGVVTDSVISSNPRVGNDWIIGSATITPQYDGLFDGFRIYDRAISSSEALSLYLFELNS